MADLKHQALIIPKSFSLNFCPERLVTKAHNTSGSSSAEEQQQLVNIESNQYFKHNLILEAVVLYHTTYLLCLIPSCFS